MFTLVVREDGYSHAAGTVTRTPAADLSNAVTLCRAEQGEHAWQTGSCTVRTVNKSSLCRLRNFSLLPHATKLGQGNIFRSVSRILSGWVCQIACWDAPPRDQRQTPWDQGQNPPWEQTPPGSIPQCSACGRYASYWNAYLFIGVFQSSRTEIL